MTHMTKLNHTIGTPPRAQITITMLDDGRLFMRAERRGRFNACYADSYDTVLKHIPALLKELREETEHLYPVTLWGEP